MTTIAVSSWSLHGILGQPVAAGAFPWPGGMLPHPTDGEALLTLPRELASRGYFRLQLCHFHLPSREADFLTRLRNALAGAGVTLDALLVDTGDLSSPSEGAATERWIGEWMQTAAVLGAERVRVLAGR